MTHREKLLDLIGEYIRNKHQVNFTIYMMHLFQQTEDAEYLDLTPFGIETSEERKFFSAVVGGARQFYQELDQPKLHPTVNVASGMFHFSVVMGPTAWSIGYSIPIKSIHSDV